MTRGFSVGVACLVGALAAMSCDEGEAPPTVLPIDDAVDAFVEAWCERLVECDCDVDFVPSPADCRAQVEAQIGGLQQVGNDGDLRYDGACLGAALDELDDRGCGPDVADGDDDDGCRRPCNAYHGTRTIGQSCEEFGNFSDCAQGLRCDIDECNGDTCTGTCRDPCARAGVGESCDEVQCVAEASCEWQETGSFCRRLPKVGDECPQGACADGLFCANDPVDPTLRTCQAPAALGEACMGHPQCTSGYCPAGFCQELPGAGDDCFGVCRTGFDCDFETSTCVEAPPGVCRDNPL